MLVMEAAGYDVVLVETVGTGQNEVEVQALTETVVLVLMPGSGDSIQALKAGLMEIPDVLVVNKADRPGADLLRADLEAALSLVPPGPWRPPIVSTRSLEGVGIAELWDQVLRHRDFLATDGRLEARRRDGLARQLRALALDRLARGVDAAADPAFVDAMIDQILSRALDPATAVDRVLERVNPASPADPPAPR
jgi:LAO/AO transport system kinase